MSLTKEVSFFENVQVPSFSEEIDWLMYRSYEFNRSRSPYIPAESWRKIYINAETYEEIYQTSKENL